MHQKREWLAHHADHLRRLLILEPRGHADMVGAFLTEPVAPGSHAGILFMDAAGYPALSGHGVIAAATIALERGLLMPGGDGAAVVFDAPAGTIRARAEVTSREVARVTFVNVPSFVLRGGVAIKVGPRHLRADVAFGGEFYAIVDAEAAGLPVDGAHLAELRRAGQEIVRSVSEAGPAVHPADGELQGIAGTIFTGPPQAEGADLRAVTVFAGGAVDRSASGTGTAAVMAVLDAMGLLTADATFVQESVTGTKIRGRVSGRTNVGEFDAIVPEIEGSAWITGDHTFIAAADDPFAQGFSL
jgi:proline racemase